MSGGWLTWLAADLRAAGLNVQEVAGWQTRARSSGAFASGRPLGVMWHHTASPASWDGARDANYCATGDPSAPLANVVIDRTGCVWVLAAGATNTNGKGGPLTRWSRGTVPLDSMNTHGFGIEFGNNGVGEPWPQVQLDAGFIVSNVVNARCGNLPSDVCTHNVWAPTRKIDPATAAAVQGPWRPRSTNSSGTWNLDDLAGECTRRASTTPAPLPPPPDHDEEDDMPATTIQANDGTDAQREASFWWDGRQLGWIRTVNQFNVGRVMGFYSTGEDGTPLKNFTAVEVQALIDSSWSGGPVPPGYNAPAAVDSGVS
jgi:hypothetical protein